MQAREDGCDWLGRAAILCMVVTENHTEMMVI